MEIVEIESNRPMQYENRLWSFILTLEAFVELNLDYDETLLDDVAVAIEHVLEHLEKKTSTPGEIHKLVTIVFYAQATLVDCYTKFVRFDRAHRVRATRRVHVSVVRSYVSFFCQALHACRSNRHVIERMDISIVQWHVEISSLRNLRMHPMVN
jgi:hypothetical protein